MKTRHNLKSHESETKQRGQQKVPSMTLRSDAATQASAEADASGGASAASPLGPGEQASPDEPPQNMTSPHEIIVGRGAAGGRGYGPFSESE